MKLAWSGLLIGLTALPAAAMECETFPQRGEQKGKFDASGEVCFSLPELGENYVSARLSGVTDARLLDAQNRSIRTLVAGGPADGQHMLLFSLPVKRASSLVLHGTEGTPWHFQWQIKETHALVAQEQQSPASPQLQQLSRELAAGGNTDAFWLARQQEGTPMVEPVDKQHKRVTFLWRGAHSNVYLLGSPGGDHDALFRLGQSDVWFRSYVVPADTLMQYKLAPDVPKVEGSLREQHRAIQVSAQADPLNPLTLSPENVDRFSRFSLLALPASRYFSAQRMAQPIRYGSLTRHTISSRYLGNSREIKIYRPRVAQPARWTMFLFDGQNWQDEYRAANVLDGLIARHLLPPVNVVFIDSLDHARRGKELPPNPLFADFMAHELVPFVQRQGITLTRQKTILAGSSYGGLASSWVALRYPRLFGNVLSLSGSYWWTPKGEPVNWLARQYAQSPRYPLRFWLQAGQFESSGPGGGNYRHTLAFEQVLREKGYPASFHASSSGHDYAGWSESLVLGLRELTGLTHGKPATPDIAQDKILYGAKH
ncbi:alpha/beta hydrolase-fold protein [Pseudocitrobacter cyperus]|uniref:Alpha/beta hydrolase-fold protein n=1 Tax=Pseudocitrobacter cyperus TaxID=3112843 RepID=A0ABV0HGK1_9ENTR